MSTVGASSAAHRYAPLWLFLLALLVRLLALYLTRTDGLYGQDAFAYFECADQLLTAPNPCSDFRWPLGYPALAALIMFLTRSATGGAQLASLTTGAAIAPLAYWTVAAIMPPTSGPNRRVDGAVAAGLLSAVCGQLIVSSIVIMSDAPGLFWASLSACLLLRWDRHSERDSASLPLAAAALLAAIVTRWIYGGLLIPFALFAVVAGRRKLQLARTSTSAASRVFGLGLPLVYGVVMLALASLVGLLLYVNAHSSAPVATHSWVVNWRLDNAWHKKFDNPDGHFQYRIPPLIFYAAPFIHPLYLCPALVACVLIGAWQLRRTSAMLILGGWVAILYGYLIGIPYENGRFGLAFFTPVAVFAGVGLWTLLARARISYRVYCWLLIGSMVVTGGFAARSLIALESDRRQQLAEIQYLESRIPATSTVVTFGLSISVAHYTHLTVIDLFEQTPQSLRPVLCGDTSAYLYVDRQNLESQWTGRSPATNYQWLMNEVGLRELGTKGHWTLYRIAACSP